MKRILTYIVFSALVTGAVAQQEVMVSQYMFNGLFLNPAYAGSHEYYSSTLLYRSQWVGLTGSPQTLLMQVDGPIKSEKMGLGLVIQHDQIGIVNQTDIGFNYSYNIKVAEGKLAFGIKGGLSNYSADFNNLVYWDNDDAVYASGTQSKLLPKIGFGAFYHSEKFYAGLSSPTLMAYDRDYKFNVDLNKASYLRRHYFATTGYIFEASDNIKVKPSILIKYVANTPVQCDFNMMASFKDAIWLGFSYRTQDALVGMIEYQTNSKFRIGYAYDFTTTDLRKVSNGTHEIMIGYDFGEIKEKKSARFF